MSELRAMAPGERQQRFSSQRHEHEVTQCPMRGRRVPEICADELYSLVGRLFQVNGASLLLALEPILPVTERTVILKEWECARNHVNLTFSLKLSVYMRLPLLIGGLAHGSEVVARRVGFQVLAPVQSGAGC